MKFTEGPWHIDDEGEEHLIVRAEDNGFIADCGDGFYNDDGDYIRSAYAEPNAQLIAAAPLMLAALQEILVINDEDQGTFNKRGGTRRGLSIVAARAAIVKAVL